MRRQAHAIAPLVLALALAGCQATAPAGRAPTPSAAPAAPTAALTLVPTVAPTEAAPTSAPTEAAPTSAPTEAAPTSAPTTPPAAGQIGGEILFLRGGDLVAIDAATGAERALAGGVSAFAATPDGRTLAVVRGQGAAAEIWTLSRDGAGLRQLTTNDRAESDLSWAPDGLSLAYTAAAAPAPRPPDWMSWGPWCAAAEARVIPAEGGPEQAMGAGCEPAFSPDGRRIAFATAPTGAAPGADFAGAANAISIVNRLGENGWRVAIADGADSGLLVHGPAWSPDGGRVAYQRFIGYQVLTDINLTEASSSFERSGEPIGFGAGWLLAPGYAPGGALVAVVEHNFSDARGFSGYDIWGATVLRLGAEEELALPSATVTLKATVADSLPRATAAAWSPEGDQLAVILPAGWAPGLGDQEPAFAEETPGELWQWRPGAPPERRLAVGLDFGSPLLWLPAPPAVAASEARIALAVPAGWGVREGPADYLVADGPGGRVIAARLVAGGPPGGPEGLFPELLSGAVLGDPVSTSNGSTLHDVSGAAPDGRRLAGLLRLSAEGDAAAVYLADPALWPLERARALSLLMASGR